MPGDIPTAGPAVARDVRDKPTKALEKARAASEPETGLLRTSSLRARKCDEL